MLVAPALLVALAIPAAAGIVYTHADVSIPVGGYYNIDVNGDGTADFTLQSRLLQGYCPGGDEYNWSLTLTSAGSNAMVIDARNISSGNALPMQLGAPVNSTQRFSSGTAMMAGLYWGACGIGTLGEWLNLPDRYSGFEFRSPDGAIHYGWVKVSTAAYVDRNGHLHASAVVLGFAYETVPGEPILAGQTSD